MDVFLSIFRRRREDEAFRAEVLKRLGQIGVDVKLIRSELAHQKNRGYNGRDRRADPPTVPLPGETPD